MTKRVELVAIGAALVMGSGAAAQLQSGNIHGTVVDPDGDPLVGVTVELSGASTSASTDTGEQGLFRFLDLFPGAYRLDLRLEGFSPVSYRDVPVRLGHNTTLELKLTPEIAEEIVVEATDPILDRRRVSTGGNLERLHLERIPTARDVWEAMRQVPGVLLDRVNVAGNESNEPSVFVGPGAQLEQHAWSIDGVVINEPVTAGTAAVWFDFDAIEEVQVTTGGSDAVIATGGVTTNLVTRRGTDLWRGSARFLLADDGLQSDLDLDPGELAQAGQWNLGTAQSGFSAGNRTESVQEVGVELGGPLKPERLWGWASWSRSDNDLVTIGNFEDDTDIDTAGVKLNAALDARTSLEVLYLYSNRNRHDRDVGPLRPPETAWEFIGRTDVYKLEADHLAGSNLYLSAVLFDIDELIDVDTLSPRDINAVNDVSGIWRGNFVIGRSERPQRGATLDGGLFATAGSSSHEVRFGLSYREAEDESFAFWPGVGGVIGLASTINTIGVPLGIATVGAGNADERENWGLYVQDTATFGALTASFGLRYDQQEGRNKASSLPANELFPALMPGRDFAGGDPGFTWGLLAPRAGITYLVGDRGKTLLRASLARFGDELSLTDVTHTNPTGPSPNSALGVAQSATFIWLDDGDLVFETNEIGPVIAIGAADPTRADFFPNTADPGFDPPVTDELILGVEHTVKPELVLGATVTVRNRHDIKERARLIFEDAAGPRTGAGRIHTRDDYELATLLGGTLPDGSRYSVPVYRLEPGLTWLGGTELTNGDREQEYLGLSLTLDKRLAQRWALRAWVNWSNWEWDVPAQSIVDPTPPVLGETDDGGTVVQDTSSFGDIKPAVFIQSDWSFSVTGLYQVAPERPWGFDVAADLYGREGYPIPYFQTVPALVTGDGVERRVLLTPGVDAIRNDDVISVNVRIDKDFYFGDWTLVAGLDVFNLLNESTVLQRQNELLIPVGDHVTEVMNPRIVRAGLRLKFR